MGKLRIALAVGEGIGAFASALARRDDGKERVRGAFDRDEPAILHEARAIAAVRAECEASGDAVEAVMWPPFLDSNRRHSDARSKSRDTVLLGLLALLTLPVLLAVAWLAMHALRHDGPVATGVLLALAGIHVLAVAQFMLRDVRAARRHLALRAAEDGSGKITVVLTRRRLFKAWYVDGTDLRVASVAREGLRVVPDGRSYDVRDAQGRPFVSLAWTRQAARDRIVEALGGQRA